MTTGGKCPIGSCTEFIGSDRIMCREHWSKVLDREKKDLGLLLQNAGRDSKSFGQALINVVTRVEKRLVNERVARQHGYGGFRQRGKREHW